MMEIDQRIPDLSDKELESLHANAVRLSQSGTQLQRQRAESLLPLIGAQLEMRHIARTKAQVIEKLKAQRRHALARECLKQNY